MEGGAGRLFPSFVALPWQGWNADIIARSGVLASHGASGDASSLLLRLTASPYVSEPWNRLNTNLRKMYFSIYQILNF